MASTAIIVLPTSEIDGLRVGLDSLFQKQFSDRDARAQVTCARADISAVSSGGHERIGRADDRSSAVLDELRRKRGRDKDRSSPSLLAAQRPSPFNSSGPTPPEMHEHIKATAIQHPARVYTTLASALALSAISPTPSFLPVVALLTTMRLSAWTFLPRDGGYVQGLIQAFFIALAAGAAHLAPSLDALSTPNVSLLVVGALTFFGSCFASATVFLGCYANRFTRLTWSQLTLFPALWASVWGFMSSVSPVGQLMTWSPVVGLGPYTYLRSVLGQWGIDWVTAAWAVIFSELAGMWLVGSDNTEVSLVDQEPLLIDHETIPTYHAINASPRESSNLAGFSAKGQGLLALSAILLLAAVPSYTYSHLPLPINSPNTTPLAVACIMPVARPGKVLTIDDYILETKRHQNLASTSILLWPESAVSFRDSAEKDEAFAMIQAKITDHKYVGVSFEEALPLSASDGSVSKRNGFALISRNSTPALTYYKRNLVPIAESFSMVPGNEDPQIFTLDMPAPSGYKSPQWAPGSNHTRPIPISVSICLDFAHSSSFTGFDSRPALILAPAKTWHVAVGYAMWEQAKSRAIETGSTIFWCDGGAGGIGGVATKDYSEIVQRGPGAWDKMVPIAYPFDTRRMIFALGGQYTAFAAVWAVVGVGWFIASLTAGPKTCEYYLMQVGGLTKNPLERLVGSLSQISQASVCRLRALLPRCSAFFDIHQSSSPPTEVSNSLGHAVMAESTSRMSRMQRAGVVHLLPRAAWACAFGLGHRLAPCALRNISETPPEISVCRTSASTHLDLCSGMGGYASTLGALLAGAFIAVFLSGIVSMQVFLYHRLYPHDRMRIKSTVTVVWLLDFAHMMMICTANWQYLIEHFGNGSTASQIAWPISVTIALTAVVTFLVQCFFAHRIYTLSKQRWYIAAPIAFFATLRVVSAISCTVQMARSGTWAKFAKNSAWLFTTGLSISAVVDVSIAMVLIVYLKKSRTGWSAMDEIIDTIVLYTVENGALTSVFAVLSLICWVTMKSNLIFLALHFAISKLYANSFLATLNARRSLQQRSQQSSDFNNHQLPVLFPRGYRSNRYSGAPVVNPAGSLVQISVEKTVHYATDGDDSPIEFADTAPSNATYPDASANKNP
ncbi:hypothetical protein NM688_g3913 [Phlebia brevispora]|uniref:Uncharacterized protein n=1 Tax=Phlebia brevispora TaxID=194682 RepID=A0ACC1T4L3_9APHY|nr:hypothetical protein NM688_g3913 [Phlebia brevispora]